MDKQFAITAYFLAILSAVLGLGFFYPYPDSDLFAGLVGFFLRDAATCVTYYMSRLKGE